MHEKNIKITKTVGHTKENRAVSCQNSSALFVLDATRMFRRTFQCFIKAIKKYVVLFYALISFDSGCSFPVAH